MSHLISPCHLGIKAHSTRHMVAFKTFLAGVSNQDLCDTVGLKSGSVKGNMSGYICNHGSPKGIEALRLSDILPASLAAFALLQEADAAPLHMLFRFLVDDVTRA